MSEEGSLQIVFYKALHSPPAALHEKETSFANLRCPCVSSQLRNQMVVSFCQLALLSHLQPSSLIMLQSSLC
jgi:hypothetical protein